MSMSVLRTAAMRAALKPRGQFIRPFSVAQPRFDGDNVVVGTDDNFDDLVLKADRPTLVNFWAEWCGPCKLNDAGLNSSAANHPELTLVKLNIDHDPETGPKYNVTAIPTLLAFNKGQVVDTTIGGRSAEQIEEFFQKQSKLVSAS